MNIRGAILVLSLSALSVPGWGGVLVHWSSSSVPAPNALGIHDLVISWNNNAPALLKEADKQGYRVYVESELQQARAMAQEVGKVGAAGIVLNVPESQRADLESAFPRLQSAYPKLQFRILNRGKLPQMRGSMVIKRDSVLEVSSPTAQPWIDTNLSLIKIDGKASGQQTPLYTFSWDGSESGQLPRNLTAADYSLAIAEAGAFHADLVLDVDEHLQTALNSNDPRAWKLWKQVLAYGNFYSRDKTDAKLHADANVAAVVSELDPDDEAMNLMARHNIPFEVFRASELRPKSLEDFDVIIFFAQPDQQSSQRIGDLARQGKTVVVVNAKESYAWHKGESVRLNESATSYTVGSGKVIELSEPVTDPETFAQDIRRLLGKQHALISLWNGLTTVAVPYTENARDVKEIEFVNYAADPLRVQVRVKGSFRSVRYESPEQPCCESLAPVEHSGFTEFVIPELAIGGRVHLDADKARPSH